MTATIHPTAVVETGAELGTNVTVGAMAYVGRDAVVHDNVTLHPKATVIGRTLLNEGVEVFPGSVLGGPARKCLAIATAQNLVLKWAPAP